jgi:hypothetical protein
MLSVASRSVVELKVTDALGRIVAEKRLADLQSGAQSIAWGELARLPAGLYWLWARQAEDARQCRFVVTR